MLGLNKKGSLIYYINLLENSVKPMLVTIRKFV